LANSSLSSGGSLRRTVVILRISHLELANILGRSSAQVLAELLHGGLVADLEHQLVLRDLLLNALQALERDHGVIAISQRPRLFVHELSLLIANLLDARVHVGAGDFRLVIGNGNAAILAQVEIGRDLEFGLETKRLAGVKVDVRDSRPPHQLEIFLLHGGLQETRHQRIQHFLADIARKARLDDRKRGLAGPESRQARFPLNCNSRALGLLIHLGYGDRNLQSVLATFD
jgi:hypothetical protein